MEKHFVNYRHQAVFYTSGSITERTKSIWIIFHGYGQLAEEFSASFQSIENDDNFVIYPQGLSKFYLRGVDKKIGSSWMTSRDRELEITNYLAYLDEIYAKELADHNDKRKVVILGFSQGGHTASRWIANSHIKYDQFILWGSGLAQEINRKQISQSFSSGENLVVIGDQDRFIDASQLASVQKRYKSLGFKYELMQYQGGHDIYEDVLQKIVRN